MQLPSLCLKNSRSPKIFPTQRPFFQLHGFGAFSFHPESQAASWSGMPNKLAAQSAQLGSWGDWSPENSLQTPSYWTFWESFLVQGVWLRIAVLTISRICRELLAFLLHFWVKFQMKAWQLPPNPLPNGTDASPSKMFCKVRSSPRRNLENADSCAVCLFCDWKTAGANFKHCISIEQRSNPVNDIPLYWLIYRHP